MPKWSEIVARIIPWLNTDDAHHGTQLRQETAALEKEQHELAPFIDDQTEYLTRRGAVNGFTDQLRLGFQQRATEQ